MTHTRHAHTQTLIAKKLIKKTKKNKHRIRNKRIYMMTYNDNLHMMNMDMNA